MKKLTILKGYYGRDNLGDEIMLEVFIKYLQQNTNVSLCVMNSNPQQLKERYGLNTPDALVTGNRGDTVSFKSKTLKRIRKIIDADLYIVGGGTILTDKHSVLHLLEYAIEFFVRRMRGRKNLLISVGSTEFKSKLAEMACRIIINNSDVCTIRDGQSYDQLSKLSKKCNIMKTGDLVYLADEIYGFQSSRDGNKDETIKKKHKVCFCLMPINNSLHQQPENDIPLAYKFATLIDTINEAYDVECYLLPIQYGDNNRLDFDYCEYIKMQCNSNVEIVDQKTTDGKIDAIKAMDVIVSMRLHALLIALMSGKKVIAIDHNPKIMAFMKHHCIESDDIALGNWDSLVSHIGNTLQDVIDGIRSESESIDFSNDIRDAMKNIDAINELLYA